MAIETKALLNGVVPTKHVPVHDATELFSQRMRKWQPPSIQSLLPLEAVPGMISLLVGKPKYLDSALRRSSAEGKPNPDCFPFSGISITLKGSNERIELTETELHDAFQYALLPGGIVDLVKWFEGLQVRIHGLDAAGTWGCVVGNGSQDLLYKAFQVFTDPGDSILIDTPAYSGTLGFLGADSHNLVEVFTDAEGLNPMEVKRVLSQWPRDKARPRVLYTVPTGSNPTGRSCTQERKIEILRLSKEYNFLIFEDDAYYFLDFADPATKARSYLSLEAEVNGETGRVLRFDSLSKIVCAGIRIGVLSTSPSILSKVNLITGNTNLQAASTTQVLALALLRHWGYEGFLKHTSTASAFYRDKREIFVAAAERHLWGKATWEVPTAGMFLWIDLLLPPDRDSFEVLTKSAIAAGVIAVPGIAFMPSKGKMCQLRASFSLVTGEGADEACRRIAVLVDLAFAEAAKRGGAVV